MQLKHEIDEITKIEKKLAIISKAVNYMAIAGGQFSLSEWQEVKERLSEVIAHIKLLQFVGVSLGGHTDIYKVEEAVTAVNETICKRLGIAPEDDIEDEIV